MEATCLTCGAWAPIEAHHVAGRRNHADLLVTVCLDCHRILSIWQRAAGIDLDDSPDRSPLDVDRALLIGLTHLIELLALRHPDIVCLPDSLARLLGRAASRGLDEAQDSARDGRWTPDPSVTRPGVTSARWDQQVHVRLVREWAHLLAAAGAILGVIDEATQERFRQVGAHPEVFVARFSNPTDTPNPADLITQFTDLAARFQETMLMVSQAILTDPATREVVQSEPVSTVIDATWQGVVAVLPQDTPTRQEPRS